MIPYELTILYDTEVDLVKASEKTRKLIKDNGGEIIKEEDEGTKRLAYRIKDKESAIYYYLVIKLPDEKNSYKICSALNIEEDILRYLLVKGRIK